MADFWLILVLAYFWLLSRWQIFGLYLAVGNLLAVANLLNLYLSDFDYM
jgi:hypothetical protein